MNVLQDRQRRRLMAAIGAFAVLAGARAATGSRGQRVELVASRFEFSVHEISARKGEPLTLAIHAPDFPHGFAIPELGVRVDCVPGKTIELTLVPDRAGRFQFLCDNFCGEGHDRMHGSIIVT